MRIRRLLLAGFITATPLLGMASAAHAAEEGGVNAETPAGTVKIEEVGECKGQELRDLVAATGDEQKQKIEDCFSAPSPVIPKLSEVFWGGLAWLLVMIVVVKAGVPAIRKTMKAREDRIRGDLEAAEQAKTSASTELEQYRAQLANANAEAAKIIDEARQSAETVRKDLVARAESDASDIRAKATDDIRLATDRAKADLQRQVGAMSVELAGKIVERNLDPATQQQLIDSYIASVGSN